MESKCWKLKKSSKNKILWRHKNYQSRPTQKFLDSELKYKVEMEKHPKRKSWSVTYPKGVVHFENKNKALKFAKREISTC